MCMLAVLVQISFLPNVHKTNFFERYQMRTIFAAYNTPSYKIAKYLVPLLTPFSINDYNVKNMSSFANEMRNLNFICEDSYMASLDIESLYTDIPLTETIQIFDIDLFR